MRRPESALAEARIDLALEPACTEQAGVDVKDRGSGWDGVYLSRSQTGHLSQPGLGVGGTFPLTVLHTQVVRRKRSEAAARGDSY